METTDICNEFQSIPSDETQFIRAASWNIAAVNNNPFEFWITTPDPAYNLLMKGVEDFIESPEQDFQIDRVFSEAMFLDLCVELRAQHIPGLDQLEVYWREDFSRRMAIAGYLKDKSIGVKRLASMPDRITNTIHLHDGGVSKRPTVINAYDGGPLGSIDQWWKQWRDFMFHTHVQVSSGDTMVAKPPQLVCSLIGPILRSKYPAITVEEQAISVPLQILSLALMDAILIYMLNRVDPSWETIRRRLCDALIINKASKICSILAQSYSDMDVIFIQEAAAVFTRHVRENAALTAKYALLAPRKLDGKRDQNSLILVDRTRFRSDSATCITQRVLDSMDGEWAAPGDLHIVSLQDCIGQPWLLVSFHGDSNGLSTPPVLRAIHRLVLTSFPDHMLLAGVDANTHSTATDRFHSSVAGFGALLGELGMISLWGRTPDPSIRTTFSARTFLQTQLNKATRLRDRAGLAHQNLKDWIVAYHEQASAVVEVRRDNTGGREFSGSAGIPSLDFPSDHAAVSAQFLFHMRSQPDTTLLRQPNAPDSAGSPFGAEGQRRAAWFGGGADDRVAGDLEGVGVGSTRHVRGSRGRGATLYDYWGIGAKPLATAGLALQAHPSESDLDIADHRPVGVGDASEAVGDGGGGDEVHLACRRQFVRCVREGTWRGLDEQRVRLSRSTDRPIWILFTARPFSMALGKTWAQLFLFLCGLVNVVELALNVHAAAGAASVTASHFALTGVRLRNGSAGPPPPANAGSMGLLADGFEVTAASSASLRGGGIDSLAVSFERAVTINGWFFVTGDGPVEADPVLFRLEASDDGRAWRELPKPPWLLDSTLNRVPADRHALLVTDLRPPWAWLLQWCGGSAIVTLGVLGASAWGRLGRGRWATMWVAGADLLFAAISAVVAGFAHSASHGHEEERSLSAARWAIALCALFNATVLYTERFVVEGLPVGFLILGVAVVAEKYIYFPNSIGILGLIAPALWTSFPVVGGVGVLAARHFARRWVSGSLVAADRAVYDAAWTKVATEHPADLAHLRDAAACIASGLPRRAARQLHLYAGGGEPDEPLAWSLESAAKAPAVMSLDQLYDQAACASVLLRYKVQELALATGGYVRAKPTKCIVPVASGDHRGGGGRTYVRCEGVANRVGRSL
jgi:hypothetical protein